MIAAIKSFGLSQRRTCRPAGWNRSSLQYQPRHVDDFTRQCPTLWTDHTIGGAGVVAVLDQLAKTHSLPQTITVDNGPEFTGKSLHNWAQQNKVKLNFIAPGKPTQNAFIESFNGK